MMSSANAAAPTYFSKVPEAGSNSTVSEWLDLIRAEYLEMPGLHLTRRQVQRLWSLDGPTCDALLDALIAAGFLSRTHLGAYVRADNDGR